MVFRNEILRHKMKRLQRGVMAAAMRAAACALAALLLAPMTKGLSSPTSRFTPTSRALV